MEQQLTCNQDRVVRKLRKAQIAELKGLQQQLQLSRSTVMRALSKVGYYSSFNLNSRFVTLKETPQFDRNGLWQCAEARFTQYHTLEKSLVALIERAPAGYTVRELQELLGVRIHNQLSALLRARQIDRFYHGRNAVYLSNSAPEAENQRARRKSAPAAGSASLALPRWRLPKNVNAVTVIAILHACIKAPNAEPNAIHGALHKECPDLTRAQIQEVFDFYELKKNEAP
jgi:hypothetical protein